MWILIADAYISLVALVEEPHCLRVRARRLEHIRALFPDAKVWCYNSAQQGYALHANDYRFQATVPRDEVKRVILERIDQITAHSFRQDIADPQYHDAVNRARRHLHAIQPASLVGFLNDPEYQVDP